MPHHFFHLGLQLQLQHLQSVHAGHEAAQGHTPESAAVRETVTTCGQQENRKAGALDGGEDGVQLDMTCDMGTRPSCDRSHRASMALPASRPGRPASSGEQEAIQVNDLHVQDLHKCNADTRAPDETHDRFKRSPLERQHQSAKPRSFCQETQDNYLLLSQTDMADGRRGYYTALATTIRMKRTVSAPEAKSDNSCKNSGIARVATT